MPQEDPVTEVLDDALSTQVSDPDTDVAAADDAEVAPSAADPVVSVLLRVALSLIVAVLLTAVLMLVAVKTRNSAPRSVSEREIATWETATNERPDEASGWARLSIAYTTAGRYADAISAARKGRAVTGEDILWLPEADALRATGQNALAIEAYTRAEKAIERDEKTAHSQLRKKDIYVVFPDAAIGLARFGRAMSEHEIGKLAAASKDMSMAVDAAPEKAYMRVKLGDFRLEAGDRAGAAEAYRAALRYVPDYREALAGLKKAEGR